MSGYFAIGILGGFCIGAIFSLINEHLGKNQSYDIYNQCAPSKSENLNSNSININNMTKQKINQSEDVKHTKREKIDISNLTPNQDTTSEHLVDVEKKIDIRTYALDDNINCETVGGKNNIYIHNDITNTDKLDGKLDDKLDDKLDNAIIKIAAMCHINNS